MPIPSTCHTCGRDLDEGEPAVVIVRNRVPVDKQFQRQDGSWGFFLEDGMPIYSVEAHHELCAPGSIEEESE